MGVVYALWIGSIALFVIGWCFVKKVYVSYKSYFIPYFIFQIGSTLLVISIFVIGAWAGMAVGFLSACIMGMGLLMALFVFIFSKIRVLR
ncbi:hypothetical protein ACLM5H_03165 [Fredinandcohnia humi]